MAKQSASELFDHYYQGLVHCLPMKNSTFMSQLRQHHLFPEDVSTTLESLTKSAEKASYFLDNVIKPGLNVGVDNCFSTLLTVMMESTLEHLVELAETIKTELDIVTQEHVCKLIHVLI